MPINITKYSNFPNNHDKQGHNTVKYISSNYANKYSISSFLLTLLVIFVHCMM